MPGEEPCALSSNKDPAQPKMNGFKNKIHTDAEKLLLRKRGDGVRCRVIKQQPGLSVSKEPLIVLRSEDSLSVSGEGLSRQWKKTLKLDCKTSWAWYGQVCKVAVEWRRR